MNLSVESFAHVSPPKPTGAAVNGVNSCFLHEKKAVSNVKLKKTVFMFVFILKYFEVVYLKYLTTSLSYLGFSVTPAFEASAGS